MEKQARPVTKTKITKILNACKFDPRKDQTFAIINECGDSKYLESRAIEILKSDGDRHMAIALLALAEAKS